MVETTGFDWLKYIGECLTSTSYCCISTIGEDGPWASPVFFAWDEKYRLYFISQMRSRHMKNLKRNPRISIAVYATPQVENVCGIQLEGVARIFGPGDEREIRHAFNIYYGRLGQGPEVQVYVNNPVWHFVEITPEHMYYFDSRFFGEERQLVPLNKLIE